MNMNASFILLVTLVVFIVDSEATPKQSRKIEELTRKNRELTRKTEELKGKLNNCRDDNSAIKKIKKLKEKLRTSESAYDALHTKYLEAGEKWIFENFPGTSLGCNTDTPRHTPGEFYLRLGGSGGIGGFRNPPLFVNSVSRGGGKSGAKGGFLKNIYNNPQVSEIALKI